MSEREQARIEQLTKTCDSLGRKLKTATEDDANQRLIFAAEAFRKTLTKRNKAIAKAEQTIFQQREHLAKVQGHHKMNKVIAEKLKDKFIPAASMYHVGGEWFRKEVIFTIIDSLTGEE